MPSRSRSACPESNSSLLSRPNDEALKPSALRCLPRSLVVATAALLLTSGCASGNRTVAADSSAGASKSPSTSETALRLVVSACDSYPGLSSSPYSGLPNAAADAAHAATMDNTWQPLADAYVKAQLGQREMDKVLAQDFSTPGDSDQADADTHDAEIGIQTGCSQAHARASSAGIAVP